jgi:hypothetical protein
MACSVWTPQAGHDARANRDRREDARAAASGVPQLERFFGAAGSIDIDQDDLKR